MRIAILSRYQNKVNRGAETVVKELVERLMKNHQVWVYAGKESDSLKSLLNRDYDIVMPMNGRFQAIQASLCRLIKKYKLIIGGHSGIGRDDILNISVAKPDVFIALTSYQAAWAKKWSWGSKIVTIPNGIDLKKFHPNGNKLKIDLPRPIILSVGALTANKNHQKSIEAVSKLKNGSLLIVGDGEEREKLEQEGNIKLKDRFRILKFNYEDMPKIYRSADLFVLPSWSREAFGIVYLEAMASGLGIVAPNDPVRKEIIGDSGILTRVVDPIKYSQAIKIALSKKWQKIALSQAKKFSWDGIALKYEKCFQDSLTL